MAVIDDLLFSNAIKTNLTLTLTLGRLKRIVVISTGILQLKVYIPGLVGS